MRFLKLSMIIALACVASLTFKLAAIDVGVVGGTHAEVTFNKDQAQFTVSATAIGGWKMKSADRTSSSNWTAAEISGNTSFTTLVSLEPNKNFMVKLFGELEPPNGEGKGPIDYSVTGYLEGQFIIVPEEKVIALGETATFTSKNGKTDVPSTWSITPNKDKDGNKMADIPDMESITIGEGQKWNPGPGEYTITAQGAEAKQKATATLNIINLKVRDIKIWWFNGEDAKNYDETTVSVLEGIKTGTCTWKTSGPVKILSSTGLNAVIQSNGSSLRQGDAKVTATIRGVECFAYLTVLRPTMTRQGHTDLPSDNNFMGIKYQGFTTIYWFLLKDQFGVPLKKKLEVNEWFPSPYIDDIPNNWDRGMYGGQGAGAIAPPFMKDTYSYVSWPWTDPLAVYPTDPSSSVKVYYKVQQYYLGSKTPSKGLLGKTHYLQYYRGRARQWDMLPP